jgi:hypothetical protein
MLVKNTKICIGEPGFLTRRIVAVELTPAGLGSLRTGGPCLNLQPTQQKYSKGAKVAASLPTGCVYLKCLPTGTQMYMSL